MFFFLFFFFMNPKVKCKEIPNKKPKSIRSLNINKLWFPSIKSKQLKELKMEKNSSLLRLHNGVSSDTVCDWH